MSDSTLRLVPRNEVEETERQQNIVAVLEAALKEARAGKWDAVTVAAVAKNGDNFIAFSLAEDRAKMVGVMALAQHRQMATYFANADSEGVQI